MLVEQISIFLENKAGRLMEVTKTLANAGVDIKALSLADTADFGILRIIVDDNEKAKSVLREKGFTVGNTDVIAVAVGNTAGGLHAVLEILSKGNVNVEYMYAYVQPDSATAALIFRFDRTDTALEVLKSNNIKVISPSSLK